MTWNDEKLELVINKFQLPKLEAKVILINKEASSIRLYKAVNIPSLKDLIF